MPRKKKQTLRVDDPQRVKALASPLRMEILQSFEPGEAVTVGDLARRLGKPRASLYYHVKKLVEIGVVVEADQRLRGKRYETLYAVAADRLEVGSDSASDAALAAAEKLVLSILRQTGREFQDALADETLEEMEFQAGRRQRAWLTPADLAQLGKLLDRIEALCTKRKAGGDARLFSVTSAAMIPSPYAPAKPLWLSDEATNSTRRPSDKACRTVLVVSRPPMEWKKNS